MPQAYIHAVRFWANRMYILGQEYDETLIDRDMAQIWSAIMKDEEDALKASTDLIKAPDEVKKDTKWKIWKENFDTYLHSKIGQASIPLAYIIRESNTPIPGLIHRTAHDQQVAGAILSGPEYNRNNGTVYDLLQSLTVNGPAWPWVSAHQRSRDGRSAWKSLVSYYEGDSMRTRSKQECYDAISKATYRGPCRNYDFNTYVHTHQQAHQELIRLGEPISKNKKVRDFLQGITDPQCTTIKLNVLSNTALLNDFSQAINYIASAIDMVTKNSGAVTSRQISELNTARAEGGRGTYGRWQNRGRSERGRGFFRGWGGHYINTRNTFRGGRGRDVGSRDGNGDNRSLTRSYTPEEWSQLTPSQRSRIYRERERMQTVRAIVSVIREEGLTRSQAITDDVSMITATTNAANQTNSDNQDRNQRNVNQISLNSISESMNRRRVGAFFTTGRRQTNHTRYAREISVTQTEPKTCRAELNSHANTCGVNDVARILEYTDQVAEVSGFSEGLGTLKDVPIVNAAVAYDDPVSGETIILIINQALYFGSSIQHILLNPNQMRHHGLTVDDVPKHLSNGNSTHSIHQESENLWIPLQLKGIISYFSIRTPTDREINEFSTVTITSGYQWTPYSNNFQEEEEKIQDDIPRAQRSIQSINTECHEICDQFINQLSRNIGSTSTIKKRLFVGP
jgi:hypothetical protein